jgi:hypothetical protein
MTQRIIYENDDGGVDIIIPTLEFLEKHTILELASKDVPKGKSFKIVDISEIPLDRTFRNAWETTITEPDGVGIGQDAWFELESKKIVEDGQ